MSDERERQRREAACNRVRMERNLPENALASDDDLWQFALADSGRDALGAIAVFHGVCCARWADEHPDPALVERIRREERAAILAACRKRSLQRPLDSNYSEDECYNSGYQEGLADFADWIARRTRGEAMNRYGDKPPGSSLAIEAGCRCPVLDNCHGNGAYSSEKGEAVYWVNEECPLHGRRGEHEEKP